MNDNVQTQAFDGMVLLLEGTALQGPQGEQGEGVEGQPGDSAYQIWLKEGNTGSEEDFLAAIQGETGPAGTSLTNRGDWKVDVYSPNDYVFAAGSINERSMWIAIPQTDFISNVEPRADLAQWTEFSSEEGPPGDDGSIWFIRTNAPNDSIGQETDCWLNVNTGEVWQKGPTTWGVPIGVLAGGGSGTSGVASVNNKLPDGDGNVTLTAADVGAATTAQGAKADSAAQPSDVTTAINNLALVAKTGAYSDLLGTPTLGTAASQPSSAFATAAQGAKADSALQSGDVSTAGKTGAYADLTGKPTLGTAAAQPTSAFATAAQGAKADSAVQPGSLATVAVSGSYNDLLNKPAIPVAVGKNLLINGNFDIWQRGITYTQSSNGQGFCADRFITAALSCTHAVNRGGVGGGPNEQAKWWHRSVVSGTSSSSAAYVGQKIEEVRNHSGKKVTISGWCYGPNGAKVGARILQDFGTGGTPSSPVTIEAGVVSVVSGSWTYFSFTVDLPSVAGKTMGSNDDSSTYVVIDYCGTGYGGVITNQSGTFGLSQLQLEFGATATNFEFRPLASELSLCQRYYEKSYDLATYPGASVREGCVRTGLMGGFFMAMGSVSFKVTKRSTPAVTTYAARNGATGQLSEVNSSGNYVANRSCNPSYIGQQNFNVGGDAYTAGSNGEYHWTADSEI